MQHTSHPRINMTRAIGTVGTITLDLLKRREIPIQSVKKLLMLILFLLVALFLVGIGVMSSLNLNYSQGAMSTLRARQINETFHGSLDRIDASQLIMEKNAAALARLGELFYSMNRQSSPDRAGLEAALVKKIQDFPEASGGGIWFEPNAWSANSPQFAAYAGWKSNTVQLVPAYSASAYNYPKQSWYQSALAIWRNGKIADAEPFQWTPAYYDAIQSDGLVTVSTPMFDKHGQTIGLATMSWRTDEVIRLVSGVNITSGSFSFLVDRNKHLLSSISQATEPTMGQELMDALSKQEFSTSVASATASFQRVGQIQWPILTRQMDVRGRSYSLYLSHTRTGMVFGIGVPQDEIDAVLEPMRKTNYRIAVATALVLLALSGVILYVVAKILRLLETLYTDRLTGLPNRARLLRDTETPHDESLIQVNIDAFKEINDFYGHHCGDHILRSVSQRLQMYLDASPYRGHSSLYRLTGDEFALRVDAALSHDALNICLQEISEHIRTGLFDWEGQEIAVNVTLGAVSTADNTGSAEISGETFLSSANMALKLARLQHRHFSIYDPALNVREEYEQNLLWAQRLKSALQENRIVPYFQPIVGNSSGRVEKFECLVRLMDDQGLPVGPGQFLGVAKKLRLYGEITRLMVRKSMTAFEGTPYSFSLNLSYEDIIDPETTGFIKRLLRETGMGKQVIFEILESEGIQNYTEVRAFIDEVKAMGCSIAIDDFGSGYSNFDHLLRLNADIIKIDGSLIRNLDTDPSAVIIVRGIVQFARELGFSMVAEFVHSAAIQDRVLALGIDYSQGAYFSMPIAVPQTEVKFEPGRHRDLSLA
jgi:c-di-GMP phosphodiesterase